MVCGNGAYCTCFYKNKHKLKNNELKKTYKSKYMEIYSLCQTKKNEVSVTQILKRCYE